MSIAARWKREFSQVTRLLLICLSFGSTESVYRQPDDCLVCDFQQHLNNADLDDVCYTTKLTLNFGHKFPESFNTTLTVWMLITNKVLQKTPWRRTNCLKMSTDTPCSLWNMVNGILLSTEHYSVGWAWFRFQGYNNRLPLVYFYIITCIWRLSATLHKVPGFTELAIECCYQCQRFRLVYDGPACMPQIPRFVGDKSWRLFMGLIASGHLLNLGICRVTYKLHLLPVFGSCRSNFSGRHIDSMTDIMSAIPFDSLEA
jgi:hypothetical protein